MGVGWTLGTHLGPKDQSEQQIFIHYLMSQALADATLKAEDLELLQLSKEERKRFQILPDQCSSWNKDERRTIRNNFRVVREDGELKLKGRRKSCVSRAFETIWLPCLLEEDYEFIVLQKHHDHGHCGGECVYRWLLKEYCRLPRQAIADFDFRSKCTYCRDVKQDGMTRIGSHCDGKYDCTEDVFLSESLMDGEQRVSGRELEVGLERKRKKTSKREAAECTNSEEQQKRIGVPISPELDDSGDIPVDEWHLGTVNLPHDIEMVVYEVEAIVGRGNCNEDGRAGRKVTCTRKRKDVNNIGNPCMEEETKNSSVINCRNDAVTVLVTRERKVVAMVIPPSVHRAFHDDEQQSAISARATEKRAGFRRFLASTMEETSALITNKADQAIRGCSVCDKGCNPRNEDEEMLKQDVKDCVAFVVGHRRPQIVKPDDDESKRCRSERDRSYLQTYWPLSKWITGRQEQVSIASKFHWISSCVAEKLGRMMEKYLPDCYRRVTRQMSHGVKCTINEACCFTAVSYNRRIECCYHTDKGDAFCGSILTMCPNVGDFKVHFFRDFKIVGSGVGSRGIGLKVYDAFVQFSQSRYYAHGNLRSLADCISIVAFAHHKLSRDRNVDHMSFREGQQAPPSKDFYHWPTLP